MGKSFSRPTGTPQRSLDGRANSLPLSCSPDCFLQEPDFHDGLRGTLSSTGTTASAPKHHTSRSLRNSLLCMAQRFRRHLHHDCEESPKLRSHDLFPGDSCNSPHSCSHSSARDHSLSVTHACTSDSFVPCEKSSNYSTLVAMTSQGSLVFGSKSCTGTESIPGLKTPSASSTRFWTSTASPPDHLPAPLLPVVSSSLPWSCSLPVPWQGQPSDPSPYLSSELDPLDCSHRVHPKTSTIGTRVTQQSLLNSAVGGATRISFVRPHERTSPYERCLATSSSESTHRSTLANSVEESSSRASTFSVGHIIGVREGDLQSVSTPSSSNAMFSLLQPGSEAPHSGKPLDLTPVTAFGDVPTSPLHVDSLTPHARRLRRPSTNSTVSLTSADLMLGTDPSSVCTPLSPEKTSDSTERFYGSSFKDHFTSTILESVTERSHDNLVGNKVSDGDAATTPTVHFATHPRSLKSHSPLNELRSAPCVYPASTGYGCSTCPDCVSSSPEHVQHTSAICESLGQRSLFGRRRLRSMPGRARAGSLSISSYATALMNEGDDLATAAMGERATVLCATDQRHILQEIQRIRLLLLKLRRLLTEDQWHLPVFANQLSMTEPTQVPRSRLPLPTEWLDLQSTETPYKSFSHHPLSELNPADSGHISDETVSPKHCDLTYRSSVTDEKCTAPSSPDSSAVEPDVASRVAEGLSLLQQENVRLGSSPI